MIPADLTLLDVPISELTSEQLSRIDQLEWYCFEGNKTNHIFVSCSELEKALDGMIDEVSPDDCVFKPERLKLVPIPRVLHRWNETDGFYWA